MSDAEKRIERLEKATDKISAAVDQISVEMARFREELLGHRIWRMTEELESLRREIRKLDDAP